jgi:5'-nucleotidase
MARSAIARLAFLVAVLAIASVGLSRPILAQDDPGAPRVAAPLTLLQLNDVYSTVPIDGRGGLARVATLKQQLVNNGRVPLMLLAGDFLSSSVASTVFKGEQMIAALNASGLDVATLGNHEFDFGIEILLQRMSEARFSWVISNVIDTETGRPIGGASPYLVRQFGSLRVGIIGLCLSAEEGVARDRLERVRIDDPFEAAARYLPMLKNEKVDAIIALTHLTYAEDRALAEKFPEIDVIVGGHEHFPITAVVGRTLISKAGSDAKFVARIDLARSAPGRPGQVDRFYELIPITGALPDDPAAAAVVAAFEAKLGPELNKVVGSTRMPLDGVAARLRAGETNLGNLVADAARAEVQADLAIINGGGIRGDRVHPPGPLTLRTLLEMHPFGNVVCKLSVSGRVVLAALDHGVARLPAAAGQFPQVSGLSFRVDPQAPAGARVRDVVANGEALALDKTYTLAIPDFLLLGGDGYGMFADQKILIDAEFGTLLAIALEKYVAGREIAPTIENRITQK